MEINKSTRLTYGYRFKNKYDFELMSANGIETKDEAVASRLRDLEMPCFKYEVTSIELTETLHKKFGKNWKSVHTELIETIPIKWD